MDLWFPILGRATPAELSSLCREEFDNYPHQVQFLLVVCTRACSNRQKASAFAVLLLLNEDSHFLLVFFDSYFSPGHFCHSFGHLGYPLDIDSFRGSLNYPLVDLKASLLDRLVARFFLLPNLAEVSIVSKTSFSYTRAHAIKKPLKITQE